VHIKGFIATQLNSTGRRVELSCLAINTPLTTAQELAAYIEIQRSHTSDFIKTRGGGPITILEWSRNVSRISHFSCQVK